MRRPTGWAFAALTTVGWGAVVVALVLPSEVAAAPAAQATKAAPDAQQRQRQLDEAKAAFAKGNTAYNLGKYNEAIANFEQAYALSRLPEILFNLGQCYRKQWEAEGKKTSALGRRALHYYEAVVREAPSSRVRPDADQFSAELGPAIAAAEAQERQGRIAAARGGE